MNPFRFLGIFIFIIYEIIFFMLDGRRRRLGYGRFLNWEYNDSWNAAMPEGNTNVGLGAVIRCRLRRKRALKACSKYCKKAKYIITLKNKTVTLVCDTKNKTFLCYDSTKKNRTATVVWKDQLDYIADETDNTFEQTFDNICFSFSDSANFNGILKVLKDNFDEIQETGAIKSRVVIEETEEEPIKFNLENRIDINTANAEKIAELPGINIVLAKRIVKYRDLKGGIKNEKELFSEFNIKEHFQTELKRMIVFTNFSKLDKNYDRINKSIMSGETAQENNDDRKNDDGERVVDF